MSKFEILVLRSLVQLLKAIILNYCHTEETRNLIHEIESQPERRK